MPLLKSSPARTPSELLDALELDIALPRAVLRLLLTETCPIRQRSRPAQCLKPVDVSAVVCVCCADFCRPLREDCPAWLPRHFLIRVEAGCRGARCPVSGVAPGSCCERSFWMTAHWLKRPLHSRYRRPSARWRTELSAANGADRAAQLSGRYADGQTSAYRNIACESPVQRYACPPGRRRFVIAPGGAPKLVKRLMDVPLH